MRKFKKLLKGGSIIIKGEDIVNIVHTPNLLKENYNKLKNAMKKIKVVDWNYLNQNQGCWLVNNVKKAGKVAIESGIVDVGIDEAVNLASLPSIAKKVASKAIKYELTGTEIHPTITRICI